MKGELTPFTNPFFRYISMDPFTLPSPSPPSRSSIAYFKNMSPTDRDGLSVQEAAELIKFSYQALAKRQCDIPSTKSADYRNLSPSIFRNDYYPSHCFDFPQSSSPTVSEEDFLRLSPEDCRFDIMHPIDTPTSSSYRKLSPGLFHTIFYVDSEEEEESNNIQLDNPRMGDVISVREKMYDDWMFDVFYDELPFRCISDSEEEISIECNSPFSPMTFDYGPEFFDEMCNRWKKQKFIDTSDSIMLLSPSIFTLEKFALQREYLSPNSFYSPLEHRQISEDDFEFLETISSPHRFLSSPEPGSIPEKGLPMITLVDDFTDFENDHEWMDSFPVGFSKEEVQLFVPATTQVPAA